MTRPRFRLRTLLIAVAVVAVWLGLSRYQPVAALMVAAVGLTARPAYRMQGRSHRPGSDVSAWLVDFLIVWFLLAFYAALLISFLTFFGLVMTGLGPE